MLYLRNAEIFSFLSSLIRPTHIEFKISYKHYKKASCENFIQMFFPFYTVAQDSLSEELELCKYI